MIKLKRNEIYVNKKINGFIIELNGFKEEFNDIDSNDILYFILVHYKPLKFNENITIFDCNLAINVIKDIIMVIKHKLKYKEELSINMINIENFPPIEFIYNNAYIFNISTYKLENDFPELLI